LRDEVAYWRRRAEWYGWLLNTPRDKRDNRVIWTAIPQYDEHLVTHKIKLQIQYRPWGDALVGPPEDWWRKPFIQQAFEIADRLAGKYRVPVSVWHTGSNDPGGGTIPNSLEPRHLTMDAEDRYGAYPA